MNGKRFNLYAHQSILFVCFLFVISSILLFASHVIVCRCAWAMPFSTFYPHHRQRYMQKLKLARNESQKKKEKSERRTVELKFCKIKYLISSKLRFGANPFKLALKHVLFKHTICLCYVSILSIMWIKRKRYLNYNVELMSFESIRFLDGKMGHLKSFYIYEIFDHLFQFYGYCAFYMAFGKCTSPVLTSESLWSLYVKLKHDCYYRKWNDSTKGNRPK